MTDVTSTTPEQSETPVEPTAEKQVKTSKVFTQEEVNGFVQTRLDRAEAVFKRERDSWELERSSYTTEKESLQSIVKDAVINVVTEKMSASEKSMFNALPFEKQLEWIKNPDNLASLNQKVTTPVTPTTPEQIKSSFKRTQKV